MLANIETIKMLARAVNESMKASNAIKDGRVKHEPNWTKNDVCYMCMIVYQGDINEMANTYKDFLFAEGV